MGHHASLLPPPSPSEREGGKRKLALTASCELKKEKRRVEKAVKLCGRAKKTIDRKKE
jgi:hypothetical protein